MPGSRRTRRLRVEELATAQGMSAEELFRFLNGIRHHELRGGLLLGLLAERVPEEAVRRSLTRHAADELRHAQWWGEIIARLGGSVTPSPMGPNWATVLGALRGDRTPATPTWRPFGLTDLLDGAPEPLPEASLLLVLEAVNRIEHEAEQLFERLAHLFAPDATISRRLAQMRDDEEFHLAWVDLELARRRAG